MSKMIFKKVLFGLFAMIVLIGFNSCHVHHTHRAAKSKPLPPGYAKKVTGSKTLSHMLLDNEKDKKTKNQF